MDSTFIKYDNNYILYENGSVYSLRSCKYLKQNKDKDGYLLVHLYTKCKRKVYKVHRLVAEHFIGIPISTQHIVNHKDGNKINNYRYNLEWVTRKQNGEHAACIGLAAKEFKLPHTKLSDKDCTNIFKLRFKNKLTYYKIAEKYKVSYQLIALICSGKTRRRIYESYFNSNK